MSIVIETFIVCESCGDNFGINNRNRTPMEQELESFVNGWHSVKDAHYCPACQSVAEKNGLDLTPSNLK